MKARVVPLRYFFIALVPVVIFCQELMIRTLFLTAELPVRDNILIENWSWLEAAGRYHFVGAAWLFSAISLLVFVLVLRDLMEPTDRTTRIFAGIVLIGIFTLAMLPTLGYMLNPDATRNYERLGGELFEAALGRGSLPGCLTPDDRWLLGICGENAVISFLNRMMDVINFFAGLGVGALIVGMILCLEKPSNGDLTERAAQLERNLQRMRRQLYLSGLVLTLGLYYATSWMRWPLPMIAPEHVDAYAGLISAASLYTGIYFSMLILSFYVPVALVLDGRKRRLVTTAAKDTELSDPKQRNEWLKHRGLLGDPIDLYKSGFALAAPVLAAFAGNIPISF